VDSQDLTAKTKAEAGSQRSRSAQRAQEAAQQRARAQQKRLLSMLAFGLLLNAIIAFVLYEKLIVAQEQSNLQQLTQDATERRQKSLAQQLAASAKHMDLLALDDQLVASLTPAEPMNSDTQAQLEARLLAAIPYGLKARVIAAGSASLERDQSYPIRFAELDLIRRAEQRAATPPEFISIADSWMSHWIRPISTAPTDEVLGTLMITTDSGPLLSSLNSFDDNEGETILLQQFPASPAQVIHSRGKGSAGPSQQLKIPGSYLALKFTPSSLLVERAKEFPTLWILCVSLLTSASLALVWLLSKFLNRREQHYRAKPVPTLEQVIAAPANAAKSTEEALANPLFHNQDILDIAMIEEDQNILGLQEAGGKKFNATATTKLSEASIPAEVFRSYDIRGLVPSQITPEFALQLGHAVGSEAIDQGEHSLIVARDGRNHSPQLTAALIKGILRSGCHVINIGVVPTPLMYFASFHFEDCSSGVMVTASHNPKEYNGFKIVLNNHALADAAVTDLRTRIINQRLHQGSGSESERSIIPEYIDRIFSDVALAGNISLVIDAGNAVPGLVAPALFDELGCEVTELFCDLDGEFPNHNPDPTDEKNLQQLIAKVQEVNADLGVAFDGDGDRLVVVTPKGDIIWPDRLLMLFAKDILARNPGADVLFDVKCSRQLNQVISSYGGRPIMWKTGHSPMKAKMVETDALIGGEYSGHIFIKDRWYGFDDGIYAMARLLEIITLRDQKVDDIFAAFPQMLSTPELKIALPEAEKFAFMEKLSSTGDFGNGNLTSIDGLRIDYPKGWGLVRASNTSPALTLRFEAESQEALEKIQHVFKRELLKIDSNLAINF
jgi:phosphomannomutase / phosphoglucomutase